MFSEAWQYELDAFAERRALQAAAQIRPRAATSWAPAVQPELLAAKQDAMLARLKLPSADQAESVRTGEMGATLKVRPADEARVIKTAHAAELAGLAFSGGGIRSATFNLGILQALAALQADRRRRRQRRRRAQLRRPGQRDAQMRDQLHVEIDIDARQIEPECPDAFSRAYCVVGEMLYERTDEGAANGTLLYVKPALMGTEYADVLNYRKANRDFPHQSTADQWFDETEFESYRPLGYRIGMKVFDLPSRPPLPAGGSSRSIPGLAEALHRKWGKREEADGTTVAAPVTPAPLHPSTEEAGGRPQVEEAPDEIAKLDEKIK